MQGQNSHRIGSPRCKRCVYGACSASIFAYHSIYQVLEGKRPRYRHIYMDSHQVQVLPPIWIAKQPAIIWAAASWGGTFGGTLASSSGKILIPYRIASRFESSDRIRIAFIIDAIGEKRASDTPYDPKCGRGGQRVT